MERLPPFVADSGSVRETAMAKQSLDMGRSKTWQEIIRDVEQERDSTRIRALAHELNEAMLAEERKRVEQRLHFLAA